MRTFQARPAVLSEAQLAYFRSQITTRNEAMFLAPQLLEHASVLGAHLEAALARLHSVEEVIDDIERCCDDAQVRAALARVRDAANG